MTIKYVAEQLYAQSVFGFFNGEKFTKAEFTNYLKRWFRPELKTTRWVMEIALPDGRWHCVVSRYSESPDGFDYYIPETREQDKALVDSFHQS